MKLFACCVGIGAAHGHLKNYDDHVNGGRVERMKATDFELRYRTLLHLVVVGLAVLTYLVSPDDIVWAIVRQHHNSRLLERLAFGFGAVIVSFCASWEMRLTTGEDN